MKYFKRPDKAALAYNYYEGAPDNTKPTVVFLSGYRSDMEGTKATYLEQQCRHRGQPYLRFDYTGHGASEGNFDDCTLEDWYNDSLSIIQNVTSGFLILVGSSMGGWMTLLSAKDLGARVKGIVTIAAAPDFTRWMVDNEWTDQQRALFQKQGYIEVPNDYSDQPYSFTKEFIDAGDRLCLLQTPAQTRQFGGPLILLHGKRDMDVPIETAQRIKETFSYDDVTIRLIDDGDHRFSRDQDLVLIDEAVRELS